MGGDASGIQNFLNISVRCNYDNGSSQKNELQENREVLRAETRDQRTDLMYCIGQMCNINSGRSDRYYPIMVCGLTIPYTAYAFICTARSRSMLKNGLTLPFPAFLRSPSAVPECSGLRCAAL